MMSYLAYLHLHIFLVVSYTVLFLVKLAFLLYGADERLAALRRRTIWLEMIIPSLFIYTGVMLAVKSHQWTDHWFLTKMIVLLMVIVLGIQTFRRNSKSLGIFTLILLAYVYGLSFQKTPSLQNREQVLMKDRQKDKIDIAAGTEEEHGEYLFTSMGCDKCHGEDGDLGYAGAADLTQSKLEDNQIKEVIRKGRKNMPPFEKYFSEQELNALVVHVRSLRK